MPNKIPESYFIYQQLLAKKDKPEINFLYADQLSALSEKVFMLKHMIRKQIRNSSKALSRIDKLKKSVS